MLETSSTPATEHAEASPGAIRHQKDPDIRLEKANVQAVKFDAHPSRAWCDIAMGIKVFVPCYRAGFDVEYYGKYIGHGHSKTAFELLGPEKIFDNKVLKVSKEMDMEPHVFKQACKHGLTTRIWYDCTGCADGIPYHCWITDRTIPLNELCRHDIANKKKCSLAAFKCMLEAAIHGLYLSDCNFFNFGVLLTENATEHRVVIIDAGSRGIHPEAKWPKSDINKKVMYNFWKVCKRESAMDARIKDAWTGDDGYTKTLEECLEWASREWKQSPMLTNIPYSMAGFHKVMIMKETDQCMEAKSTSGYKIMELVGRFACDGQWSEDFALACYRAARKLNVTLQAEEMEILDELYSRMTRETKHGQLKDVIAFWERLREYREAHCHDVPQGISAEPLPLERQRRILYNFKYYELWKELTWTQQQTRGWWSTLNTMLNNKAGWTFAAKAILTHGLPKLQQPDATDPATEQINALGQFAEDLARWLHWFASRLHEYKQTGTYQKARAASDRALNKRRADRM